MPETRKLEHLAEPTKSYLEIPRPTRTQKHEMMEDEDTFTKAPWRHEQIGQTVFVQEIRGYQRRAADGVGWNEKRHGVRSCGDTVA